MIKVCGTNEYFQLNEVSNNQNDDGDAAISPPIQLDLDPSNISSFSSYNEHTVLITRDGKAQALGSNEDGKIGDSLPKKVINHLTEFTIQDDQNHAYNAISSVCGYLYTLYKVSNPEHDNEVRLAYSYSELETKNPLFLNIGNLKPLAIYGGYENSAAIDTEGSIIFIPDYETSSDLFDSLLEPSFLPENEKVQQVACCDDFIVALGSSGRLFISNLPESGNKLQFSKVSELEGTEIVFLSGTCLHCLAVSKEGKVFAYGQNNCGQLGFATQCLESLKFTQIEALNKYNIVAAYAGGIHSLFQTSEGKILACGSNNYLQIPINKESCKLNVFGPIETDINEGASFCITGDSMSAIFINYDPPNCPNKKISKT